jgi:hypothetical protein
MIDRKALLIKEILNEGKLTAYEAIVITVIENIMKANFKIAPRYDSKQSITRWKPTRQVILSLRKAPLAILWALFHEFGHIISGENGAEILSCEREEEAWNNAFTEIKKHPSLSVHISHFDTYRQACLKTYQNSARSYRGSNGSF